MNINVLEKLEMKFLFVDCSYITIHIFYETLKWYKLIDQGEYGPKYDWSTNKIFMNRFREIYLNDVLKICKKYSISYDHVIFVQDCPKETIWRKRLYDAYKENRKKQKSHYLGNVFRCVYNELFPKFALEYGMKNITVEEAEADDVIAILCRWIHGNIKDSLCVIISNDRDFLQLTDNKTHVFNVKYKLSTECAVKFLLKKIISGDYSDNIPPCVKNVNMTDYLCANMDVLRRLMENNDFRSKFIRNRNLIDFECVPEYIKNRIVDTFYKSTIVV